MADEHDCPTGYHGEPTRSCYATQLRLPVPAYRALARERPDA